MPYKLRSDHPDCTGTAVVRSDTGTVVKCHPDRAKALAHLRALYANVESAAPAADPGGYVPGGPRPVVIENHPGCPPSQPHGLVNGSDGHLLACHATTAEAKAIAEKLDLSEPSGQGDPATAAARSDFDPAKHPRIEHGHGGGEFTRSPGGGLGKLTFPRDLRDNPGDPPPTAALKMKGRFTLADAPPAFMAKVDAKLTHPKMGTGPNKGKVMRPAVPAYAESVARTSAAMTKLIADQGTLDEGKRWYPDEHEMNHRRAQAYHVPITTAIGVEAATCPRVQWIINQRVTNELLDEAPKVGRTAEEIKQAHHFGGGVMASFRDEAVNIILGTDVDKELGGTKRRNFYNNIMWPGQTDSVTVDTWMLQSLKPLGLDDRQAMALGDQAMAGLADGLGKVIVADALRDAAARYRAQGVDITPDGVQAAAWIAIQKQLGLSDPSAHDNPRDTSYMLHAAAPDPDDDGGILSDDEWDAELILQYLEWLAEKVPGGVDLGSPGSARPQGGLAADNPAAWKLALADPRFGRLGMTADQARQAAHGPGPRAAAKPGSTYIVKENHPACPAHSPHGVVHSGTGELAGCRPDKTQAQTLALTLNFPDATPATPGAVMQAGTTSPAVTARDYVRDDHGKFAPVPGHGTRTRPRPRGPGQAPRQPATAPAPRRPGEPRPGPPPGAKGSPAAAAVAGSVAASDIARMIDQQVAAATDRLTRDQHRQLAEVKAELERSQAELDRFHKTEITEEQHAEEKRKSVRKLIHHILALAAVAALTFIGVKTGTVENPMIAGLAATGPLFIQEALDAIKRV